MEHLSVSDFLTERGEVDSARLEARWSHLLACGECRDLVATYQFLSEAVAEHPAEDRHLGSDEVCELALGGRALDQPTRDRCQEHVEGCLACSHEVDLVRGAVRESRENVVVGWPAPKRKEPLFDRVGLLAVAATLAILLAGVVIVARFWSSQPKEYRIAGLEIQSEKVVETEDPVFVESTRVEAQGTLTLQSPIVSFGNGFSVDSGAGLIVGVGSISAPLGIDETTEERTL